MIVVGGIVRYRKRKGATEYVDALPFLWWMDNQLKGIRAQHSDAFSHLAGMLGAEVKESTLDRTTRRWRVGEISKKTGKSQFPSPYVSLAHIEDWLTGSTTLLRDIYPVAADEIEEMSEPEPEPEPKPEPKPASPRFCRECDASIDHKSPLAHFCSSACCYKYNDRRGAKDMTHATCQRDGCDASLAGRHGGTKFCSHACREANWYRRHHPKAA